MSLPDSKLGGFIWPKGAPYFRCFVWVERPGGDKGWLKAIEEFELPYSWIDAASGRKSIEFIPDAPVEVKHIFTSAWTEATSYPCFDLAERAARYYRQQWPKAEVKLLYANDPSLYKYITQTI